MLVIHANWTAGRLWLWAERPQAAPSHAPTQPAPTQPPPTQPPHTAAGSIHTPHPFAARAADLLALLADPASEQAPQSVKEGEILLHLPARGHVPLPSTRLAHAMGQAMDLAVGQAIDQPTDQPMDQPMDQVWPDEAPTDLTTDAPTEPLTEAPRGARDGDTRTPDPHTPLSSATPTALATFAAPALGVSPADAWAVLDALEDRFGKAAREHAQPDAPNHRAILGPTVDFFLAAARLSLHLLAQQRFVPTMRQVISGELHGVWMPWLSDAWTAERVGLLLSGMPPAARAAVDEADHQPWPILESFLTAVLDAHCRQALRAENMAEAIQERDPLRDPQVAWLAGLLDEPDAVPAAAPQRSDLIRNVRTWLSTLEERGSSSAWRLMLQLAEPVDAVLMSDVEDPEDDCVWTLSFHLQSQESTRIVVDAADIWALAAEQVTIEGKRLESPQELLLKELARAARLYRRLDAALNESEPTALELNTRQAYEFLREIKPILIEQGFAVRAPEWWDLPSARLGARLKLTSESLEVIQATTGVGAVNSAGARLGLGALVNYTWDIAIGGMTLSLAEFEKLAAKRTPLVRINGRWVEIRPEDVKAAVRFLNENPGGEMRVGDAIRLAYDSDVSTTGIPIVGLEAEGWVNAFFNAAAGADNQVMPVLNPPATFHGSLRPYQLRGLSWLSFLERLGFGPCLADDMGLGKTIQLLALLAHEREQRLAVDPGSPPIPPSLLIVPMSVVGNWLHEARRFCPELRVLVHHGLERPQGEHFKAAALASDAVITTYTLAHRDRETLAQVHWHRIVLDEAQYVKNPTTKQSEAVRNLSSTSRVALTGTPVENRLSELWSIMDFLNPGYLGPASHFRKRFSVPIERYHDAHRSRHLKELVRPFLLRRLKSDPAVAADLPEKLETREFCHLTPEQAQLYETVVRRMLAAVDAAEGIQRRGLVLSTLVKLKQICNHPAQYLKENDAEHNAPGPVSQARSGKCVRLMELLDEVIASGEQAIIFTQFRQMGDLLVPMLQRELDREVAFLHGATPQAARVAMVDRFQKSQFPILLVSLKAGGVGLNLTAATHVFHFDRWWNPAVENQATDRAHRIGQYRTVQVHKFVVRGTLEERIDAMIEQKTELAQKIIGSGESWLTELSTDQLRDMLTLREEAVGEEP